MKTKEDNKEQTTGQEKNEQMSEIQGEKSQIEENLDSKKYSEEL